MSCKVDKKEYIALLTEKINRRLYNKINLYYPETGPLRRDLYTKHMSFFGKGREYRERAVMAANRIGKTEGIGGYELALHLTGQYPDWWEGRRFTQPVSAWACGSTGQTVRDILQRKLLGPPSALGTGLLAKDSIAGKPKRAPGTVPDKIERVSVYHHNYETDEIDGISELTFKSYDQKRKAFEGTEQHIILLDEEPPIGIYTECVIRTMTTNGIILLTFTPLEGLSEVVLSYMPSGIIPETERQDPSVSKFIIQATWDDVPHLSEKDKKSIISAVPPYQRDARSKGIPQLGSGVIFGIAEEQIAVDDFPIPDHWPRVYGMDVGWNWTAAVWGAIDRETDTTYLYANYKAGKAEPAVHKDCIQAKGTWIPGTIDPAANASGQYDGKKLLLAYRALGLNLAIADNAVEAGLFAVWTAMTTAKLKVFKSMREWLEEFRVYRRNDKGRVVKHNDHLMDATRYLIMSGLSLAKLKPSSASTILIPGAEANQSSWMNR